jgi:hypothetical protein
VISVSILILLGPVDATADTVSFDQHLSVPIPATALNPFAFLGSASDAVEQGVANFPALAPTPGTVTSQTVAFDGQVVDGQLIVFPRDGGVSTTTAGITLDLSNYGLGTQAVAANTTFSVGSGDPFVFEVPDVSSKLAAVFSAASSALGGPIPYTLAATILNSPGLFQVGPVTIEGTLSVDRSTVASPDVNAASGVAGEASGPLAGSAAVAVDEPPSWLLLLAPCLLGLARRRDAPRPRARAHGPRQLVGAVTAA